MRNKKIETKKQPLYIFLHLRKCAGSTVKEHVLRTLKKDEFLFVYDNEPPYLTKKEKIEEYINSLTKEKIKVIAGHMIYYGIDKLFPNREVRYITFFRNPVDRVISQYNFRITMMENIENVTEKDIKRLRKQHLRNGKMLNFREWFLLSNNIFSKNFMFKDLFIQFFDEKIRMKNIKVNKENLKKIKRILDKFYFIGITENPEDFLFLYHELGIKKFFPNANISKRYFIPKNYEKIKKFVLSKNKFDQEIYKYALRLNKKFKRKHKDFYKKVEDIEIKRKKYCKTISYYLICLEYKVPPLINKLSAKLKKHSRLYTKFVKFIKNEK